MAIYSSILAQRIPGAWCATVHRVGWGPKELDVTKRHTHTHLFKLVFLSSFPEVKLLGHVAVLFLII